MRAREQAHEKTSRRAALIPTTFVLLVFRASQEFNSTLLCTNDMIVRVPIYIGRRREKENEGNESKGGRKLIDRKFRSNGSLHERNFGCRDLSYTETYQREGEEKGGEKSSGFCRDDRSCRDCRASRRKKIAGLSRCKLETF